MKTRITILRRGVAMTTGMIVIALAGCGGGSEADPSPDDTGSTTATGSTGPEGDGLAGCIDNWNASDFKDGPEFAANAPAEIAGVYVSAWTSSKVNPEPSALFEGACQIAMIDSHGTGGVFTEISDYENAIWVVAGLLVSTDEGLDGDHQRELLTLANESPNAEVGSSGELGELAVAPEGPVVTEPNSVVGEPVILDDPGNSLPAPGEGMEEELVVFAAAATLEKAHASPQLRSKAK